MESENTELHHRIAKRAVSLTPRYAKDCMIWSKKNLMTTLIKEACEQLVPGVDMDREIKSIRKLIRENATYRQEYENIRKKIFPINEHYNSEQSFIFDLMAIAGIISILVLTINRDYFSFVAIWQLLATVILSIKFREVYWNL